MSFMHDRATPLTNVRLLLVDDEPDNLDLLEGMLARTGYQTERCELGIEALRLLRSDPERFDAVLLDRMMPGMDGIQVLQQMKDDPRLQSIPVILQTAAGNSQQIAEGLQAGAHYYLVKPFDRAQLLPILKGAISDFRTMRDMRARLQGSLSLGIMHSGEFEFGTLAEGHELANLLARASGEPSPVVYGLRELLNNAVEHGNLEIGFEAKRDALIAGNYEALIEARARDPRYASRRVFVSLKRTPELMVYTIRDEGQGFDWRAFMDISAERLVGPNGRGIQLARELSFDTLTYLGTGNEVRAEVSLAAWREL